MQTETPNRILRLNTVLDRTGLSRSTMYRKMQNGTFPKSIQISTRCVGWRDSAIAEWMRNPVFYRVNDIERVQNYTLESGLVPGGVDTGDSSGTPRKLKC